MSYPGVNMNTLQRTKNDGKSEQQRSVTVIDAALTYLKRGWKPVPIQEGEKGPRRKDWPSLEITRANVREHFEPKVNIGIQLGKCSGGLTDIDLDCREAMNLAADFLPETGLVFGRKSKPRAHFLYVTDLCDSEQKAAIQFKDPVAGSMLVEMRIGGNSKGAQTMLPPSRHPTGERVKWDSDGEAAKVNGSKLKTFVSELAAAALLVRHYPGEGSRHDGALALGGMLARAKWSAEDIGQFVTAVALAAGDEEWRERASSAQDAIDALENGRHIYGVPKVRELWGQPVAEAVAKWLGISNLNGRIVLPFDDPVTCAEEFVKRDFLANSSCLQYYRGNFYHFTGSVYAETDAKDVRSRLYAFFRDALTMRSKGPEPFKPTQTKVNSILE
jgi:hypothetical protein